MKIIGGIVSFEDGVKTVAGDQFSPTRKVRVELNFSLDESGDDADAAISAVLGKARVFVNRELGVEKPTNAARAEVKPAPAPAPAPAPKSAAGEQKPISDKDKLAAASGLPVSGELTPPATSFGRKAPARPKPEKTKPVEGELGEETPPAKTSDSLDDLLGSEPAKPAKEITDADLNDAVQKTNGRINTPESPGAPRIRKLVAEYVEDKTKQAVLRDIPQAKRAEFVAKLAELT